MHMIKTFFNRMSYVTSVIFLVVSFSLPPASSKEKKMQVLTDSEISLIVKKLPVVELPSDFEKEILSHDGEITKLLQKNGLGAKNTFQHVVALNQLSPVTQQGLYYVYVVSLFKKKVIRIEGDDLWLIEKGKKKFSQDQKTTLLELLSAEAANDSK